jgi:hypothetical protein
MWALRLFRTRRLPFPKTWLTRLRSACSISRSCRRGASRHSQP